MVRQCYRAFSLLLVLSLLTGHLLPAYAQDDSPATIDGPVIRVGSKDTAEQQLLGQIVVLLLQEAGYAVEDRTGLGSSMTVRTALEDGEIDLYPEYTGTALTLYNGLPSDALPNVASRTYELARSLDQPKDLVWLERATFNNSSALLARDDLSDFTGGEPITDLNALADYINGGGDPVTVCVDAEFYGSNDGLLGLQERYGFTLPEANILLMDTDDVYANLVDGQCEIAQGTTTDGRITLWDLQVLEDPLGFFHFEQPALVARAELLDAYPELPDLLNPVMAGIDRTAITTLNARVALGADAILGSGDEEPVAEVALNFLMSNGLIMPPPIRVGSKEFTEQLLLGKLFVLLLRESGYEVEDITGYGGTTQLRRAVEAGEIDIYPEYTGTSTSVHHEIPVTALPTTAQRSFALARSLDAPAGLIWLEPMPFNNTYTMMVRQETAAAGMQTMEDLAAYLDDDNADNEPLTLCIEGEFYARPDGLEGLQNLYGFTFPEEDILIVETSDTYQKLRDSECDVAEGFATDGRISAWNLVNLDDTLAFFPFYNPAPVVRRDVLELYPELAQILNNFSTLVTESAISDMNARVDIGPDGELASGDEESIEDVAYSFLRANRLVALPEISVSVADPEDAFHNVFANMLMLILADAGYQVDDMTGLGGGPVVRQAMLNGDVDIYMESVAHALSDYHDLPVAALPTTQERAYVLAQTLDEANDIQWLNLMDYNESYAIVTADALAEEAIESLDDFALYMIANDAPASICMDNTFYASSFNGLDSLESLYGFEFQPDNILLMDDEEVYDGLDSGECDVAAASGLDAAARGYTVLADPLEFFLDFGSAPVVRGTTLQESPEITELIDTLTTLMDEDTAEEIDQLIELGPDGEEDTGDELSARQAAQDFLVASGVIAPPVGTDAEETNIDTADTGEGATDGADEEAPDDAATPEANDEEDAGAGPASTESPELSQSEPDASGDSVAVTMLVATPLTRRDAIDTAGESAPPTRILQNDTIVVGAMADTEQQLLGRMLMLLLEAGGYPVAPTAAVGTSPDLRSMLRSGEIDIYPEFTGAALSLFHNIPLAALPTTPDGAFSLASSLDEPFNIVWFRKASFDSAYSLAVSPAFGAQNITSIADIALVINEGGVGPTAPRFCVEEDFLEDSALGLPALATLYEIPLDSIDVTVLTLDEIYRALQAGQCDVGEVLQTDGRIDAWDLRILEDPLGAFPNFTPAPIARQDLLSRYPELDDYLGQLGPLLASDVMRRLNAAVELGEDGTPNTGDELAITAVAEQFLCDNQLLASCNMVMPIADGADAADADASAVMTTTATSEEDNAGIAPIAQLIPFTATVEVTITEPVTTPPTASLTVAVTTPSTFGVNARAAADPNAEVVAVLPRNTTVDAIARTADGSWLQIVLVDGELAWVFTAAILTDTDAIQQLPIS